MRWLCGVISVLTLALPARSAAQRPSGFWYSFGLAPGWASVTCDICSGDHRVGLSGTVRLGGRTSPAVAIGAELSLWREHQDGVTQSLSALGAVVYWRPTVRRPLYLKGGAGLVTHRADDGTDIVTSTGVGPIFGIGYDLRAGRRWVLGPYFSAAIGVIGGGVKFNGGTVTKQVTVSFFQLGVSLTRP